MIQYRQILWLLAFLVMLLKSGSAFSQDDLENLTESITELALDEEQAAGETQELLDEYLWLASEKIKLDENGLILLTGRGILTEKEAGKIRHYIYRYGKIYTLYELAYIDGISVEKAKELSEIIQNSDKPHKGISIPERKKLYVNQELIIRYGRVFPAGEGYSRVKDTLTNEKIYKGGPERLLVKYRLRLSHIAEAGFTLEKDPGEELLAPSVNLKSKSFGSGFDYQSGYLLVKDLGILRSLIIGDYQVRIGQGLNFWSGLSFNHQSGSSIYRSSLPFKPYTSSWESGYLRGVSAMLAYKGIELLVFGSRKKFDATAGYDPLSDSATYIRNFRNSGYHRTATEILSRHNFIRSMAGACLTVSGRIFRSYISATYEEFSALVNLSQKIENLYHFRGRNYMILGSGTMIQAGKVLFSTELSLNRNYRYAFSAGITYFPADHLSFAFQYRQKQQGYVNFNSSSKFRTSNGTPEEGIYLGIDLEATAGIRLSGSINYSRVKWIRSLTSRPSSEIRAVLNAAFRLSDEIVLTLKYSRFRRPEENKEELSYLRRYILTDHNNLKFRLELQPTETFRIRPALLSNFNGINNILKGKGLMMALDLLYDAENIPFSVRLRLATFNTTDYDSRIYLYEHDVYGSMGMPPCYGSGHRAYLVCRYGLPGIMDIWFKAGIFYFTDRKVLGSGYDRAEGNKKIDVKLQLRLRL